MHALTSIVSANAQDAGGSTLRINMLTLLQGLEGRPWRKRPPASEIPCTQSSMCNCVTNCVSKETVNIAVYRLPRGKLRRDSSRRSATITTFDERIDKGPCPRSLCDHIGGMHVSDGHCVVCASKKEIGEKGYLPCALGSKERLFAQGPLVAGVMLESQPIG